MDTPAAGRAVQILERRPMTPRSPLRPWRPAGPILAGWLAACGGGGSGGDVIPPFRTQAGLVAADLNGDGLVDVAVAGAWIAGAPPHAGDVAVYLQAPGGGFAAPQRYPVGPDPWGLSVGDLDGDGRPDLVAATPETRPTAAGEIGDSGGVSLLRQDPAHAGRFLASTWVPTGGMAEDAALTDIDGDGHADLVVADGVIVNGRALLLRQDPAVPGRFGAPVVLPAGSGRGADDLAVADLNGDGLGDLVLAATTDVVVFLRLAGGGYGPATVLAAGPNAQGVAAADLDGDGRADLVVANAGHATGGASVGVLRQTTPGRFVRSTLPVANGARRVAVGDLNGDGLADLAVVSIVYPDLATPSRITVLLQSPTARGSFAVSEVLDGPYSGQFIAIADVDGDGRNDLLIDDGPSVMRQRADAPGHFRPAQPLR